MPLLRVYIAASLDGYIATPDGGVKWLDDYFSPEIDFNAFTKQIGATIFGRKTFDQTRSFGNRQSDRSRVVVLTRRPIPPEHLTPNTEVWNPDHDNLKALAERLKADLTKSGKDIWLIGGGESIDALHAAGLVDRWEIFIIPVLLGDGIPLFPKHSRAHSTLQLTKTKPYKNGIIELHYEPARQSPPANKPHRKKTTNKKATNKRTTKSRSRA